MQHLVFVYGTLRENESNHHFVGQGQFLGHHETLPEYTLYDLGAYPAVVEGHQVIFGEVYLVNDAMLAELDKLEDVPVEYRRELIPTPFGEAWIYLYQDASQLDVMIASGDWCQRV
ncbi:gamma-glutamylcyclotransferase family protein [Vibrio scophthalmi]|uniref:Gamma-glutamylcyclotransferase family protein n=1 Tax=Vibrio scophthalmi TaxID=45658 RepID=A0A1C7F638_9VIBR|nr:gamma-glutamylcyclotransferase family protein [Vibrio scophthalmi]ANU35287.1 Putative gamma-glutamylcyclotransferase [Vibrio scophthalmi]